MKLHERFTWREIEFGYTTSRDAWVGSVRVAGRVLWFMIKDLEPNRPPSSFQAWVEWEGGYTVSCTMKDRDEALEGARLELLDVTRKHHEDMLARFG